MTQRSQDNQQHTKSHRISLILWTAVGIFLICFGSGLLINRLPSVTEIETVPGIISGSQKCFVDNPRKDTRRPGIKDVYVYKYNDNKYQNTSHRCHIRKSYTAKVGKDITVIISNSNPDNSFMLKELVPKFALIILGLIVSFVCIVLWTKRKRQAK